MTFKAKAACGDEDGSLSILGLCSDFYVSKRVPTMMAPMRNREARLSSQRRANTGTSDEKQVKSEGGKAGRARPFAQFILSGQGEILRFAQNDPDGLRMTAKPAMSEDAISGTADGQSPSVTQYPASVIGSFR